jgi:hypothetical protein
VKVRMKIAVGTLGALGGVAVLGGVALAGTVNLAPTCQDDTFDIAVGVALEDGVADLCSDPNPQTILSFGLGSNTVANGTLDFDEASGDFLYTPNPGFAGTDDFSFFADDNFPVVPSAADDVSVAAVSEEATITINVAAAQVTTTTSTTVAVAPTSATAAPTTVLARTGGATTTTAGGGLVAIGVGLGLVAASGALVTRARRT